MFVTADQLVCHAIGDYILQSDYMAQTKTKRSVAALAHVVTYALPFLFLTRSWKALLFIVATHFVIDRWRLARYICWAKNFVAPKWLKRPFLNELSSPPIWYEYPGDVNPTLRNWPWWPCKDTGYLPTTPRFLAVWLMIITDNLMHVLCNAAALRWL